MNIFLSIAISTLQSLGKPALTSAVQDWYNKNPEHSQQLLKQAYVGIDGEIEDYVKTTKTKIDDGVVDALKQICESIAEVNDFELPNVDEGKKND